MGLPNIELVVEGNQTMLASEQLADVAVAVPRDVQRFEGQVVVFLDDLLRDHSLERHIRCTSPRGETYTFPAGDVAGYCLLSTNAPSWKLVPAGRDKLSEITVPRFVLREVQRIELGVVAEDEAGSDEVFTNLTDALLRPKTVRFLNLTNAYLEVFPPGIFDLTNLESLNLGQNRIREVPPEIGTLRNLQVLKLSRNRLRALPDEIGRLKQLTELHASRNEIESLPEKFWNLENLQLLNLGSNRLTSIPDDIQSLKSLRELELDENPIPGQERQRIEQLLPNVSVEW